MSKRNFHENFTEFQEIEGPSNKNFGYTVGGIFTAIGALRAAFFDFGFFSATFLIIGTVLLTLTLAAPDKLTPLNALWMKLGLLLFKIVNPVVMVLMYAVCIVPAGLIMKLLRYDPMHRKFDKDAKTYWVTKEKTDIENPMKYQF